MMRQPPRSLLLGLAALLFGLAVSTAAITDPHLARVPAPRFDIQPEIASRPPQGSPPPEPQTGPAGPPPDRTLTVVVATLLFLLLLGVLLALLWQAVRGQVTLRRVRPRVPAGAGSEQVRAAVAAGLDDLALDSHDPRAAVIGCWLRLERVAAEAGTARQPSDSPADLVARMLAAHQVSAPVLDRFAAVYRQARYAPHVVGADMRDAARAALRRLHAELSGSREKVTDEPG